MRRLVVKTALCLAIPALIAAQTATAKSSEAQTIAVNGIDIRYIEQGSGPMLVLVHGALGNYNGWTEHMTELSKDFRVVSYSQRYYGVNKWDKSSPPLTVDQQADDLAGLIGALNNGKPAHAVGWSMGGVVLHKAVLKHPTAFRSAYLYEGLVRVKVDPEIAKADQQYYGGKFAKVGAALKAGDVEETAKELITAVSGGDATYYTKYDPEKLRISHAGMVKWMTRKRLEPIDCETMAKNTVPVKAVAGTKTMFDRGQDGRWDKCLGANASAEWIENATHMWPRDDVKAFSMSVRDFSLKH